MIAPEGEENVQSEKDRLSSRNEGFALAKEELKVPSVSSRLSFWNCREFATRIQTISVLFFHFASERSIPTFAISIAILC